MSALENALRHRSPSPGSSGRDSPLGRPRRRHAEDDSKRQDKGTRRYAAAIERALASFDTGRLEWPDYISFLGRLLKAIQAHPPAVDSIPHKTLISNRLAQCLNPALPAGVHQKAIEVYDYIFSLIGKTALARDLSIYLPGLSSVLSFASLKLRPHFLLLIESHILPLDISAIRPALKALILGLLPGLEDESSEEFDRTLQIFDKLRSNISQDGDISGEPNDAYFWQSFFLASIGSPSRRPGALAFLIRRLPKLVKNEETASPNLANGSFDRVSAEAECVISPEPGLLIRCFATGLRDDQYLLQRGFLDLLLTHLPLHSPALTKVASAKDLERLIGSALSVTARRDMSLNRRLWSWLLGPEMIKSVGNEDEIPMSASTDFKNETSKLANYFSQYGRKPLIECMLALINSPSKEPFDKSRPFRVALSLMDRWEVGGQVVQQTFLPAMQGLFHYKSTSPAADFDEVLKSAHSFFDGVESGVIWGQILKTLTSSLKFDLDDSMSNILQIHLVEFMITTFNVREEEMMTVHEPLIVLYIMLSLNDQMVNVNVSTKETTHELLHSVLNVLDKLTRIIPERTNLNASFGENGIENLEAGGESRTKALKSIQKFYFQHNGHLSLSPPPFSSRQTGNLLLSESGALLRNLFKMSYPAESISSAARICSSLATKLPDCEFTGIEELIDTFILSLSPDNTGSEGSIPATFLSVYSTVQIIRKLVAFAPSLVNSESTQIRQLLDILIQAVWQYLSPSCPKHHVESVRCLWQLDTFSTWHSIVEASISGLLQNKPAQLIPNRDHAENIRRFMVLWSHTTHKDRNSNKKYKPPIQRTTSFTTDLVGTYELSDFQERLHRPLMLTLDALIEEDPEISYTISNWVEYLPDITALFEILLTRLSDLGIPTFSEVSSNDIFQRQHDHEDTSAEYLYYLKHIENLLVICTDRSWSALHEETASVQMESGATKPKSVIVTLAELCTGITRTTQVKRVTQGAVSERLQLSALSILQIILKNSSYANLRGLNIDESLIAGLRRMLNEGEAAPSIQIGFLDTILPAVRIRSSRADKPLKASHTRTSSLNTFKNMSKLSMTVDTNDNSFNRDEKTNGLESSPELLKCIQDGISSTASTFLLDSWVKFLSEVLPLYMDSIFQNLIPLVEAFCKRINILSDDLKSSFREQKVQNNAAPEASILSLLNGLEGILATAHLKMQSDEEHSAASKSPETPQSFFGNVVSGVFAAEAQKLRSSSGNTRLTVILCFQDTLRTAFDMWSWTSFDTEAQLGGSRCAASFAYISQRIRNRTRRILDRMFQAEALECLEFTIFRWASNEQPTPNGGIPFPAISLLQVLDGSRPNFTMPALFSAIYSRNNPALLESSKQSTLTSDISEVDVALFLIDYTVSLDDDAMDEIWSDCVTFLRDILANPLPHTSIQPCLLIFVVILAEKLEKTNFGEQRKMRKELGDLFVRLLNANVTVKSGSYGKEPLITVSRDEKNSMTLTKGRLKRTVDLAETLVKALPRVQGTLLDEDRVLAIVTSISTHILSPIVHSKHFPSIMARAHLELLLTVCKISNSSKVWKKDVHDAFFSSKFFTIDWKTGQDFWAPILKQWLLGEKDRISDLCTRIAAPASAGIMFGVGAGNTRLDADRKTQMNLRRIALSILAADIDFTLGSLTTIEEKVIESLQASTNSSPSSAIKAEIFMILRAIVLRTTFDHLIPFWPLITSELQKAISASLPHSTDYEAYNVPSLLQACKLLEFLLAVAPDDFQMVEWLFIADTIDAVYRPANWEPVGIADEIAEELDASLNTPLTPATTKTANSATGTTNAVNISLITFDEKMIALPKPEFVNRVLRPFFSGLSIRTYEATYSMTAPDWSVYKQSLMQDIFNDITIVG